MSDLVDHFRTRTPKGDGNARRSRDSLRSTYISEHEPRKGTETALRRVICSPRSYFRTRTPKGDGNHFYDEERARMERISEHEPRKGTETSISAGLSTSRIKFQNTNPERGRKLNRRDRRCYRRRRVFQNTNPERGRKQFPP